MHYKTIVLELLEQQPKLYENLRSNRMLLPKLDQFARSLKTNHETWKKRLSQTKPGSDEDQIASEALEFAISELENFLHSVSHPDTGKAPSLAGAMAFIRRRPPPE